MSIQTFVANINRHFFETYKNSEFDEYLAQNSKPATKNWQEKVERNGPYLSLVFNEPSESVIEPSESVVSAHYDSSDVVMKNYIKRGLVSAKLSVSVVNRATIVEIGNLSSRELESLSDIDLFGKIDEIKEAKINAADAMMMELIREEEQAKQKTRGKGRKRGQPKGQRKQPDVLKKPSQPWPKQVLQDLNSDKNLKVSEHPRVTDRWKDATVDVIREFDDGKYQNRDDEELAVQRARHYLPGLEKIVKSEQLRDLYNYQTSRGADMLRCRIKYANGKKEEGAVYLGYGKQEKDLMIHRYFEPYENFATGQEVFSGKPMPEVENDTENSSETTSLSTFEKIKKDGSLKLTFVGEEHKLYILPMKVNKVAELLQK